MERRSGQQRRKPFALLKPGRTVGRRLDDLEFSVLVKMGLTTAAILTSCMLLAFIIS